VSKLVIDASTAAKWQLSNEPEAEKALSMLMDYANGKIAFVAPKIWQYEIANILNKAIGTRRLTEIEGRNAFDSLLALEIEFIEFPSPTEAYVFARKYQRSVYDSFYLAVAEHLSIEFWTGDRKLYNAIGSKLQFVRWIGDYSFNE
jgi:predicted nucleic acid-binding protein